MKCLVVAALVVGCASVLCAESTRLVDAWTVCGIPAYGQQTAGLSTVPPAILTPAAREATRGARYGRFTFGADTIVAVALRTTDAGQELLVDANADGDFGPDERASVASANQRPPGFGKTGAEGWLMRLTKPHPRLAAFRMHSFGMMLVCALRGYAAATIPAAEGAGVAVDIAVVDANANMLADYGSDLVYADLDGNGALDPRAERATLQEVMELGPHVVRMTAAGPLERLSWGVMASGTSAVTFTIAGLTSAPHSLQATLGRRPSGVYHVSALGESIKLPMGVYRVEGLSLQAPAPDGAQWAYQFTGSDALRAFDVDKPTETVELLGELSVAVECAERAQLGRAIAVSANVISATGLRLGSCGPADFSASGGLGGPPVTACLIGSDGAAVTPECSFSYG